MEFLYNLCGTPFGWIMRLIYQLVDNYALAILIFTIITKLIIFPISYWQQLSTAKMQKLNPKLEKLRQKYKDDRQKLQEAQMKLYQDENINPRASCLPMFLQFFILFGILDVVYKPLSFIFKVGDTVIDNAFSVVKSVFPDLAEQGTSLQEELAILQASHSDPSAFADVFGDSLSAKIAEFYDKFTLFDVSLGTTPEFSPDVWNYQSIVLFIIPFVSGLLQLIMTIYTQIVQRKRNPSAQRMGCMNVMLYIMPLFSVWFAFQVPAGVGFYWVCSSFFSLVQSVGLNLYFTEKRVDRIIEKQNKKLEKKYASGKKTFTQRMAGQVNGPTEAEKKREEQIEAAKNMSKADLAKYRQQVLKEARERMAKKYGDAMPTDEENEEIAENQQPRKKKK